MIKNFNQLNEEYVPNNKSTNFSNSTCRRRLLDKFIGAGKWEYVYNGNKAVAVKITDEEEVVEEVIEEAVEMEDLVEELELDDEEEQEIRTEADCDAEIARCKNDIDILQDTIVQLQARIKEMKEKKLELCDVKKVFRGIKFTKYANFDDVQAVYVMALYRYNKQKGKPGIEAEFDKVKKAFLKQVDRHLSSSTWSGFPFGYSYSKGERVKFKGTHPDVYEWVECYKKVWNKATNFDGELYTRYSTADSLLHEVEDFEYKFTALYDHSSSCREYICNLQYVLNQCQSVQSDPLYVKINNLVADMQAYIVDVDIFNRKGKELFEEFKNGWTTYFNRRKSEQDRKKQQRQQYRKSYSSSYSSSYSGYSYNKYFSGCSTEQELKKKHREWAKKLHPDRGGNAAQFRAMQEEYETLKKRFSNRSAC